MTVTLTLCCVRAWLARDTAQLQKFVPMISELADLHGYTHWATRARGYAGWIAATEGQVAEGIRLMESSLASNRAAGTAIFVSQLEAMLADAYLLRGDAGAALAHVDAALRVAGQTAQAWLIAELHRRRGNILWHPGSGKTGDAAGELQRALEIARSQSALLFALRAARDLARCWRDQGRAAEAHDLLAPVYASFTEGFASPDLVEARALLEKLGAPPTDGAEQRREEVRTPHGPDRLCEPVPGR